MNMFQRIAVSRKATMGFMGIVACLLVCLLVCWKLDAGTAGYAIGAIALMATGNTVMQGMIDKGKGAPVSSTDQAPAQHPHAG